MKRGGLIFAHNSREVDYGLLAVISGGLAKKHLDIPLTLVTDIATIDWLKESNLWDKANSIFEKVLEVERPTNNNTRRLNDGVESKVIPFINADRASAWDLTPYDQTLLLDSDYLIFSDVLNNYWDIDESVLIASSMNDITGQRAGFLDKHVSETGVHLFWATTVIFKKDQESKIFFDFAKMVRDNYDLYADIFRFNPQQYRNDIGFSVVKHLMDGFNTDLSTALPSLLTTIDKDMLFKVEGSKLTFLINDQMNNDNFVACAIKDTDVHIMNKQSIIRQKDSLLELL
jgi:hypothetical protein